MERLLRSSLATALATWLVALAVYAATAARTVTLVDSGELVLAARDFGVAHPPGFPVYVLLGWLASRVPIGPVAFRLALFSGLAAAVVAVLAGLAARELAARPRRASTASRRRKEAVPAWIGPAVPLATGLAMAVSKTLWTYAVVAEVYTLSLAFVAAAFVLVLRWRRRLTAGESAGLELVAAGLLFGLALGVHHVTALLASPALLAPLVGALGWRALGRRDVRTGLVAVAVALLAYLQLPLAAARRPLFAWGEPTSWGRIVDHVSGKQYQVYFFAGWAETWTNVGEAVGLLVQQLGLLGLLLAVFGACRLWARDRPVGAGFLLASAATIAYAAFYDIAEDGDAYLLFPFFALVLLAGQGLAAAAEALGDGRRARLIAAALAVALPLVPGVRHARPVDRSSDRLAPAFVADVLASVEPGGVLLTREWQLYSPWLYLHHVEGLRPDAVVVDVNLVRRSWYVEGYLARAYPALMAAVAGERDSYLALLKRWEAGLDPNPDALTRRFVALLDAMLAWGQARGGAYLTLPLEPGVGSRWRFEPVGLAFRLEDPAAPPLVAPAPELDLAKLRHLRDPVAIAKVRPLYAAMLSARSGYLARLGHSEEAEAWRRRAAEAGARR